MLVMIDSLSTPSITSSSSPLPSACWEGGREGGREGGGGREGEGGGGRGREGEGAEEETQRGKRK